MAFLGLSLTCARCHNHPMEKWTQDQYYGMANLFARVQLKDGGTAGDVVVVDRRRGGDPPPAHAGWSMPPQPLDAPAARRRRPAATAATAFADWLARPDNPYFARAIVNRVWRNFFGRGLIDPEDDLRATNPPSDEPLLDWLVADFRRPPLRRQAPDPHDHDLGRLRPVERAGAGQRGRREVPEPLPGQAAAGRGPARRDRAVTEVPTAVRRLPGRLAEPATARHARSTARSSTLVRPARARSSTCSCERSAEPSMAQALHLANGTTINEKLRSDAGRRGPGARREGDRRRDRRPPLPRRPRPPPDRGRAGPAARVLAEPSPARTTRRPRPAGGRRSRTCTGPSDGNEFLFNH